MRRLDTANADVSGTLEAMSISLLAGRRTLYARLEHLMGASTRYADRLAKIAISATAQPATDSPDAAALASRFEAAVDHVLASAALARAAVCDGAREPVQVNQTVVLGLFADSPSDPRSPQAGAVIMLSRLNWVLLRAAQVRRDA
ncbi:hypothetical protein GCM10022231_03170 [Gordonia caeni]|uniref:Uncharacterized protein n=2 Tax=Gordonia caeni TaxID=1007097 RepID=A0ABP7NLA2_9ACTN